MIFSEKEIVEITRKILIALGVEVQKGNNLLFYQESKSPIFFESHPVKANIDYNQALFTDKDDVRFNPIDTRCTKLTERFFARFLEDNAEEENIPPCVTYFFDRREEDGKYSLVIKFEDGSKYTGKYYINKIICIDEAIFRLDGTFEDEDLSYYDIDQTMWGVDE